MQGGDFLKLVLFSYNASHYHTNLAIRALRSAVRDLETPPEVSLLEFSLKDKRDAVLHALYSENAPVYGFSAYIWNITETLSVAESLKKLRPDCKIFFGGPEVSYKADEVLKNHPFIDSIIIGEGEEGIKKLLSTYPKLPKKIHGAPDSLFLSRAPHYFLDYGTPEDLPAGKLVYYESSRGCPFSCGYCLSGGDCSVRAKSAEATLDDLLEFEKLNKNGGRTVKLVDRTFNYDLARAKKIWRGLLDEKYTCRYHFEIQPSIIDDEALEILSLAPKGKFQLEAGIQSTDVSVLAECGRGGNIKKELLNLRRLKAIKTVPVHVDLICGLPLDSLDSIKRSVNEVYHLSDELQIGFLKLLSGTKIAENAEKYGIKHRSEPPYEVLCTSTLSFDEIYLLKGIAHTVDRVANSGRFALSLSFLLGEENGKTGCDTPNDSAPVTPFNRTPSPAFANVCIPQTDRASNSAFSNICVTPTDHTPTPFTEAYVTPFDFFSSLSQSLEGNPAAYSQAAIYEKVYATGLKYIEDSAERERFAEYCREDFRRCERTRMPPLLALGTFKK